MHRLAVIATALVLPATAVHGSAQSPVRRPPNIVLVMMDDMGYGDLGSYGATDIRTPDIDRLARQGVRLTDAYANGPVCTPTRAALISGRYQQRAGLEGVLTYAPADLERGLPASATSLPALLRANGYATGLLGKWHLGWKPEFGPMAHGFDEFYGFLSGAHSYYTDRTEIFHSGEGPPDLFENTTPVKATGYLTDELTRRAVGFIGRHAGEPFFLEVSYNAVHWPFEPPGRPVGDSGRGRAGRLLQTPDDSLPATRADYARILERADRGVGEILAELERRGLTRNTLVIFTNDNGGEWLSRNTPLYHRKGTLWEGGIRVPLIMRWPGALPRGKVSRQPAITVDVTASILAAAGVRLPEGYRPDGIDLLPILRGDAEPVERTLFWRWTLPVRHQSAVRSGRWKLLVDGQHSLLFDLGTDPGERTDLAAQRPDLIVRLKKLLARWEAEVGPEASGTR